jgi:hypothetical protein
VDREVDRRGGDAVVREDRRCNRAKAVGELLVVDREAVLTDALQLQAERRP